MNSQIRIVSIVSRVAALLVMLAAVTVSSSPPANAQDPLPVLEFTHINYYAQEPEPGVVTSTFDDIHITLTPASSGTVTVNLTVREITTDGVKDFILPNQAVTFAPNVTSVNIPLTLVGNDNPEQTERFQMMLSNPVGAEIATSLAQVTIDDSDQGSARLEIDTALEGQSMRVDLVISPAYEYELSFGFEIFPVYDATLDDIDIYFLTQRIPAGTTRSTISIATVQDDLREGFESVRLMLFRNNENINIPQSAYRAWIADDDLPDGAHFSSDIDNLKSSLRRKSLTAYESGDPETTTAFWLTRPPTAPVTVTPTWGSGDPDLDITPASHTFTPKRWDPAFFTLTAADDDDAISGTRTLHFRMTSQDPFYDGYDVKYTSVVEVDDDADADGHIIHSETHPEVNGITASMFYAPQRRDDNDFWVFLQLSEPISAGYRTFWHQSLEHWGGQLTSLHAVDGRRDLWAIEFHPHGRGHIAHLQVPGNRPCNEPGAICTRGGRRLANTLTYSVAPPGVDAKLPPGIGPVPMLSVSDHTVAEDAGTVGVMLTLNKPATRDSTVQVLTHNAAGAGDARDGPDYQGRSETVTIAQGESSYVMEITIRDDDVAEGDEEFGLLIYNADGVELEGEPNWNHQLNPRITIIDDD